MFDYISGKPTVVDENKLVIDCGGVGFLLTASIGACVEHGNKEYAKVPVYLAVREDALELYGFRDEAERKLFMLLINVSGVGAKLAVSVLSGLPMDTVVSAIASTDAATISTIKGVGKKIAERIVLELKGKVDIFGAVSTDGVPNATVLDDKAVLALVGLGYEKKEAESAVKKVYKTGMTTEDIVRAVLQGL
ncbi:MAG: Holliday junction branch migration protein RuvA [Clostridiales bacterium]|nr:Holliday junction branch migration protein RuvA [Clostridiales bacterium]